MTNQELTYLNGIGPQRAKLLHDELGLSTWDDLLHYFPYKHIDRSRLYSIAELSPDMPFVQLRGHFMRFSETGVGRKRRLVGLFSDGSMTIEVVWFGSVAYLKKSIQTGKDYIIFGRPGVFGGRLNIQHPDVDPADSLMLSHMSMQPYYSVTERMRKQGMTSRSLEHFTNTLLSRLTLELPETLPAYLVERLHLMSLDKALRAIHYPSSADELAQATMRLKWEELFYVQLSIMRYARRRQEVRHGHVFRKVGVLFNTFYHDYLPFELTAAQKRVVREMKNDMSQGKQMNRLLQGDVGSGKTLVALLIMLLAIDNGAQTCIMAPTEILAEQHLATFKDFLKDMPIRVELLTGTVKGKRRKEILQGLQDGEVNILVGTHAVIEDEVVFHNLGLVVIDEQHRFGVAQRARLWRKNALPPHVMVMTATPIPRTLAMTLYGDLDVSIINELPPGRKPVKTIHYTEERLTAVYRGVQQELDAGHQAYFVYPLVKESDKMALKNVQDEFVQLQQIFPRNQLSMVHGQMKPAEKDEQMQRFVNGETQILVATTVIEVGVNVPNASVMVIHNAERFGLSQLHQLRGRVGRGARQSYCLLVTGAQLAKETRRRMQVMTETCNGFEIAEEDLRMRGPGDLEGTQQSGVSFDLKLANLARDGQLVQLARDTAAFVLDGDPQLVQPQNQLLVRRLNELNREQEDWGQIL